MIDRGRYLSFPSSTRRMYAAVVLNVTRKLLPWVKARMIGTYKMIFDRETSPTTSISRASSGLVRLTPKIAGMMRLRSHRLECLPYR